VTLSKPPAKYVGTPKRHTLRRGTCLWRVHKQSRGPRSFNPMPVDPLFGGARFDATPDDQYPYFYAALDENTAVIETMVRDLELDEEGYRAIQRPALANRVLSGLALTRDLELVSLVTGPDLGAIGQDAWLVTAPARDYPQTRAWAHWLRDQAPWAHGFIWSSLRDPGGRAIVLFGDRCAADFGRDYQAVLLHEVPELAVVLDDKDGIAWLNRILEPYRVVIP
jgi:hypothetical protein